MAYQIIQKNGVPTAVIDGQEYPLLNNFDTGEVMPSGANGGYVKTGPNSGYYINGLFAGGPIHDLGLSKQDNMQAYIEAGKRNGEDGWLNKIMPAVALATFGGIGASAYGAGVGMAGAGTGAAAPVVGGAASVGAGTAPVYFDAGLGGFVDAATGMSVPTTQAASMIDAAVTAGTMTPAEAMAAMTNYANTMAPTAFAGGAGAGAGMSLPGWLDAAKSGVSNLFNGGGGSSGLSAAASGAGSLASGLLSGNGGLGAIAGGLLAGSSLGQSKQAGTTTTTNVPWGPMQPYLTGLAADAQSLYNQNKGTPQTMTNIANLATQNAIGYQDLSGMGRNMAYQANNGMFDPVLGYVNDVSARGGFASMGDLDPSGAYARMLSGQVSPYVDQQAKAIMDQANQNLSLNVMPSIRSGAQSAGQYGSSRQGIAEGVAAGLSNQGVTQSLANLYGNAWNTAQNQMGNAASQLGQMGNANQQYNAQLGLNRNTQNMSAAQQALGARQTGMNLGTSSYGLGNGALTDAYNMQTNLNQYPWQNVKNYQGVVAPLAGMGSSQSTPYYTNQANNILGGALAGYKLFGG